LFLLGGSLAVRLRRFKPAVRPATLLLASAGLWSGIGFLLLGKGCYRLGVLADQSLWLLPLGILAGTLKSYLILDHAARHGVARLSRFSDATCLGAVYSWKTWILVLCMMAMGGILQRSSFPPQLLTLFSLTIGWALLFSSRFAWSAWRKGHAACQ
jgi:hypothetical protein